MIDPTNVKNDSGTTDASANVSRMATSHGNTRKFEDLTSARMQRQNPIARVITMIRGFVGALFNRAGNQQPTSAPPVQLPRNDSFPDIHHACEGSIDGSTSQRTNSAINDSHVLNVSTNGIEQLSISGESCAEESLASALSELRAAVHPSFAARSNAVWSHITANNPGLEAKIEAFKSKYAEKIELLNQKTWNALKVSEGIGMTEPRPPDGLSLDEFRNMANAFINEVLAEALVDMGLSGVDWQAPGTPGYNSDVDFSMNGKDGVLSIEEAFTIKSLRDTAHTFVMGGLSGIQLDTECYTTHPGAANTSHKLVDHEAKEQFVVSEHAMALLQGKIGAVGDPEGWEAFCQAELVQIEDDGVRRTTAAMITVIDDWHNNMHVDVMRQVIVENPPLSMLDSLSQGNNGMSPTPAEIRSRVQELSLREVRVFSTTISTSDPIAYKRAALNYKTPIILEIATGSRALAAELHEKHEALEQLKHFFPFDPSVAILQREYDTLLVKYDLCSKMLNSLLDEGTLSQSEGNVTLFKEGGQVDQRLGENVKRELKKRVGESLVGSVVETREAVIRSRPKMVEPRADELSIAAYEEQQQFRHVMHDGLSKAHAEHIQGNSAKADAIAGKIAINAGKYNLRTIRNKLRAMEKVEKKLRDGGEEIPEDFINLKATIAAAEKQALHLEQCKRKFTLNEPAAKAMLTRAIVENNLDVDHNKLEADLDAMLKKFDPGEELTDESLLKRNKMSILVAALKEKGYVAEVIEREAVLHPVLGSKLEIQEKNIETVLRGLVGYKREKDPEINKLFTEMDGMTLEYYGLNNMENVEQNADYIEDLSRQWQNMAFRMGVMPRMVGADWVRSEMNFIQIWNNAKIKVLI